MWDKRHVSINLLSNVSITRNSVVNRILKYEEYQCKYDTYFCSGDKYLNEETLKNQYDIKEDVNYDRYVVIYLRQAVAYNITVN